MTASDVPEISIVIPIHDEEPILHAAVVDLRERLREVSPTWEILLCENGSSDRTRQIASALAAKYPEVRSFSIPAPNYGQALRLGILNATGQVVVCEEIDLCDVDFHMRALEHLRAGQADMVLGSKLLTGASDERPYLRHLASRCYSEVLRWAFGLRATDTHGLKAFRRALLLPIIERCVVDMDVFASELVIRAERAHIRIKELPVRVIEKRRPSINLLSRMPRVAFNLLRLSRSLRSTDR